MEKKEQRKELNNMANEIITFLNEELKPKKYFYCYMYCHARFESDKERDEHCYQCDDVSNYD